MGHGCSAVCCCCASSTRAQRNAFADLDDEGTRVTSSPVRRNGSPGTAPQMTPNQRGREESAHRAQGSAHATPSTGTHASHRQAGAQERTTRTEPPLPPPLRNLVRINSQPTGFSNGPPLDEDTATGYGAHPRNRGTASTLAPSDVVTVTEGGILSKQSTTFSPMEMGSSERSGGDISAPYRRTPALSEKLIFSSTAQMRLVQSLIELRTKQSGATLGLDRSAISTGGSGGEGCVDVFGGSTVTTPALDAPHGRRQRRFRWRLVYTSNLHGLSYADMQTRVRRVLRAHALLRVSPTTDAVGGFPKASSSLVASVEGCNRATGADKAAPSGNSVRDVKVEGTVPVPTLLLIETSKVVYKRSTTTTPSETAVGDEDEVTAASRQRKRNKARYEYIVEGDEALRDEGMKPYHVCVGIYLNTIPVTHVKQYYHQKDAFLFSFCVPVRSAEEVEGKSGARATEFHDEVLQDPQVMEPNSLSPSPPHVPATQIHRSRLSAIAALSSTDSLSHQTAPQRDFSSPSLESHGMRHRSVFSKEEEFDADADVLTVEKCEDRKSPHHHDMVPARLQPQTQAAPQRVPISPLAAGDTENPFASSTMNAGTPHARPRSHSTTQGGPQALAAAQLTHAAFNSATWGEQHPHPTHPAALETVLASSLTSVSETTAATYLTQGTSMRLAPGYGHFSSTTPGEPVSHRPGQPHFWHQRVSSGGGFSVLSGTLVSVSSAEDAADDGDNMSEWVVPSDDTSSTSASSHSQGSLHADTGYEDAAITNTRIRTALSGAWRAKTTGKKAGDPETARRVPNKADEASADTSDSDSSSLSSSSDSSASAASGSTSLFSSEIPSSTGRLPSKSHGGRGDGRRGLMEKLGLTRRARPADPSQASDVASSVYTREDRGSVRGRDATGSKAEHRRWLAEAYYRDPALALSEKELARINPLSKKHKKRATRRRPKKMCVLVSGEGTMLIWLGSIDKQPAVILTSDMRKILCHTQLPLVGSKKIMRRFQRYVEEASTARAGVPETEVEEVGTTQDAAQEGGSRMGKSSFRQSVDSNTVHSGDDDDVENEPGGDGSRVRRQDTQQPHPTSRRSSTEPPQLPDGTSEHGNSGLYSPSPLSAPPLGDTVTATFDVASDAPEGSGRFSFDANPHLVHGDSTVAHADPYEGTAPVPVRSSTAPPAPAAHASLDNSSGDERKVGSGFRSSPALSTSPLPATGSSIPGASPTPHPPATRRSSSASVPGSETRNYSMASRLKEDLWGLAGRVASRKDNRASHHSRRAGETASIQRGSHRQPRERRPKRKDLSSQSRKFDFVASVEKVQICTTGEGL